MERKRIDRAREGGVNERERQREKRRVRER